MSTYVKPATQSLRRLTLEVVVRILRSLGLRLHKFPRLLGDRGTESKGYVVHRGYRLPPKSLRGRMCGDAFRTDSFYFLSAVLEASKFSERLGHTQGSHVVDIGSGLGRLATGLLAECPGVRYLGIDANQEFVRWC